MFNEKLVPGFSAKNKNQKSQIIMHNYTDVNNFLIKIIPKEEKD